MIIKTLMEMPSVTMVDGCFDPIHQGHVAYFEAAAAFGDDVFCFVAADKYISTKHPVLLPGEDRICVINAFRNVQICNLGNCSTAEALSVVKPKRYVKGADWKIKGLPQNEIQICNTLGIEIIFVDTTLNSSSRLIERLRDQNDTP